MPSVLSVERLAIFQDRVRTILKGCTLMVRTVAAPPSYLEVLLLLSTGGCCKQCGSVEHLRANCPEKLNNGINQSKLSPLDLAGCHGYHGCLIIGDSSSDRLKVGSE